MRGEGLIQGLLDLRCSRYFRWRDLFECGQTFRLLSGNTTNRSVPLAQLPAVALSWANYGDLAQQILDPLFEAFGPFELSYGFAPPSLTHHITAGIAPKLDQHAACEVDHRGKMVCDRGGAAVDLVVPGRCTADVVRWLAKRGGFDRLYYYGPDRSVHVSWHPVPCQSMVEMAPGPSGRLLPRKLQLERLREKVTQGRGEK